MNDWARGKYKGRANFVCVSCDGPELAQSMGERMKLTHCINTVTASSGDGPYWGQLGCSGFIILSPGSQQVITGKTMAYLDVKDRAFRHVESVLEAAIQKQAGARIKGIASKPELNGLHVKILYHDSQSGRRIVQLGDGTELKLKPENLELVRARIKGIASKPQLNGQYVEIIDHDSQSGRQIVKLANGTELKLKPENLEQQDAQNIDEIKLGGNPNAASMSAEGS